MSQIIRSNSATIPRQSLFERRIRGQEFRAEVHQIYERVSFYFIKMAIRRTAVNALIFCLNLIFAYGVIPTGEECYDVVRDWLMQYGSACFLHALMYLAEIVFLSKRRLHLVEVLVYSGII